MKKKIFLSATSFMLAIGGAFATQYLLPEQGFSKQADVQLENGQQTIPCKARKVCEGGNFTCKAGFIEGSRTYTQIDQYALDFPPDQTVCTILLTHPDSND